MANTLNFRNSIQKALFLLEIQGQISDGMWENTRPFNHWMYWGLCKVGVDPSRVGRNFYPTKDNYNLTSSELLGVVGYRMRWYAALVEKGYKLEDIKIAGDYIESRYDKDEYWDRVKELVNRVFGGYENLCKEREGYSFKQLRKELEDMKTIFKTYNSDI